MLFIAWLYGEQNQVRPMFPPNTPREDLIRASKSFESRAASAAGRLGQKHWGTCPVQDIIKQVDGPARASSNRRCRSKPAAA
jgi:hypothetical protein